MAGRPPSHDPQNHCSCSPLQLDARPAEHSARLVMFCNCEHSLWRLFLAECRAKEQRIGVDTHVCGLPEVTYLLLLPGGARDHETALDKATTMALLLPQIRGGVKWGSALLVLTLSVCRVPRSRQ